MKTSIIIPAYNQGEYLEECLDSIQQQTLKPYEVFVVNDGSTDNSLQVAQKYSFKVINTVNRGLASARNCGIMNSTGDYILFLDADDVLLENCLEIITGVILETNADIIAPSFKCFGKSQDVITLHPNPTLEMFKNYQNFLPYFCAVKREKLLEVGGYSPKMVWGWEDLHLWINLLIRGATLKTIPDILVLYRTKEDSMWTRSKLHQFELKSQLLKDFPEVFSVNQ